MFPDLRPISYLITEGKATNENFLQSKNEILEIVSSAIRTNVHLIQIREKNLSAKNLFDLTQSALRIAQKSATKILLNDRIDVAICAKANGVHLTSTSIPVEVIRKLVPKNFIIGKSTHDLNESVEAKKKGADFVTFSPIFATPSKMIYGKPQGLEKLEMVCQKLGNFPVIALGGISETNFESVLKAGAAGYASITFHHKQLNKFSKAFF